MVGLSFYKYLLNIISICITAVPNIVINLLINMLYDKHYWPSNINIVSFYFKLIQIPYNRFRYTSQKSTSGEVTVYALVLDWPVDGQVKLGAPYPSPSTTVTMLGLPQQPLKWSKLSPGGMVISMPILSPPQMPCQWAWTLKITNLMWK